LPETALMCPIGAQVKSTLTGPLSACKPRSSLHFREISPWPAVLRLRFGIGFPAVYRRIRQEAPFMYDCLQSTVFVPVLLSNDSCANSERSDRPPDGYPQLSTARAPIPWKSRTLSVTSVKECTIAVAAIHTAMTGRVAPARTASPWIRA
jgi:hypothetical protein